MKKIPSKEYEKNKILETQNSLLNLGKKLGIKENNKKMEKMNYMLLKKYYNKMNLEIKYEDFYDSSIIHIVNKRNKKKIQELYLSSKMIIKLYLLCYYINQNNKKLEKDNKLLQDNNNIHKESITFYENELNNIEIKNKKLKKYNNLLLSLLVLTSIFGYKIFIFLYYIIKYIYKYIYNLPLYSINTILIIILILISYFFSGSIKNFFY